jgi:hypothetical protein
MINIDELKDESFLVTIFSRRNKFLMLLKTVNSFD